MQSQPIPFQKEIDDFRERDRVNPPKSEVILFIGSSTFTNWKTLSSDYPDKPVLNRAFGGSSLLDLIRHSTFLLGSYRPKQIVIYCGENDFTGSDRPSAVLVADRFQKFKVLIRQKLNQVPIVYVGMKPSWSRWHLRSKFLYANRLIQDRNAKDRNFVYIDLWDEMTLNDGTPDPSIFLSDELHMNRKGYERWIPVLRKVLM